VHCCDGSCWWSGEFQLAMRKSFAIASIIWKSPTKCCMAGKSGPNPTSSLTNSNGTSSSHGCRRANRPQFDQCPQSSGSLSLIVVYRALRILRCQLISAANKKIGPVEIASLQYEQSVRYCGEMPGFCGSCTLLTAVGSSILSAIVYKYFTMFSPVV
jgi:hypothetical protein